VIDDYPEILANHGIRIGDGELRHQRPANGGQRMTVAGFVADEDIAAPQRES
jgi:hypothetical protein